MAQAGKRTVISVLVHRFIAYPKFGDNIFKEGIVVRHLDDNPNNNTWNNLELGTPSQNMMDKSEESRIKSSHLASLSARVYSDEEINLIRKDRASGLSYKEIGDKWNITKSSARHFSTHLYKTKK